MSKKAILWEFTCSIQLSKRATRLKTSSEAHFKKII